MELASKYKSYKVSQGTLDIDELMYSCSNFLFSLNFDDPGIAERVANTEQKMYGLAYVDKASERQRYKKEILFGVFDILKDIAPKDCFFGGYPGNPARVGFWRKSLRVIHD
jgi:hypothetical protein